MKPPPCLSSPIPAGNASHNVSQRPAWRRTLEEALLEIEGFNAILRRGDDLTPEEANVSPARHLVTPELIPATPTAPTKKARGTMEEFKAFAKGIGLPPSDGEAMFWKFEANGWKNGRNPVKDWQATMRQWKCSSYHPSQNQRNNGHGAPAQHTGPVRCIL